MINEYSKAENYIKKNTLTKFIISVKPSNLLNSIWQKRLILEVHFFYVGVTVIKYII